MKKLPRKTEKVLREMAKEYRVGVVDLGALDKRLRQDHPPHEHNHVKCDLCARMMEWGRESMPGIVKCNHPEPKPIVIRITPWHIHMAWLTVCILVGLLSFGLGCSPNWAGAVK